MPIFGRRGQSEKPVDPGHTIRNVAGWEKAAAFLAGQLSTEYQPSTIPALFPLIRRHEMEVLQDKGNFTMLIPASEAVHAPVATSNNMGFWRLDELNAGSTTMELPGVPVGTTIVGLQKTTIRQKYADGFVACVKEVYNAPWQSVRVLVNRHRVFPIVFVGEQIAFVVSPTILEEKTWKIGKYEPR